MPVITEPRTAHLDRADWIRRAKCRDYQGDPDDFFPARGDAEANARMLRYCLGIADGLRCPVLDHCRAWAMRAEAFGVWGATTEDQRLSQRRARTSVRASRAS